MITIIIVFERIFSLFSTEVLKCLEYCPRLALPIHTFCLKTLCSLFRTANLHIYNVK